jgi:hypothetical protein
MLKSILLIIPLFVISCNEKTPELSSLNENNINRDSNFTSAKSVYYINDPSESITITGKCDSRFKSIQISFDEGITWKDLNSLGNTLTEDNCTDSKYSIYLDQVKNYFSYDASVVGNQTKTLLIKGDLGFTQSSIKKIIIQNGDFTPPAMPNVKTLSTFSFAKIYIDPIADTDFSGFECSVNSGIWYLCTDGQIITMDGSTEVVIGFEGDISVRAYDNTGNRSNIVTKIFKKGKLGRGVDGKVESIEKISDNRYLLAGKFNYYEPIPSKNIVRFNSSDMTLDHSWNKNTYIKNGTIDNVLYNSTYKKFIATYNNDAQIFDENWNFEKSIQNFMTPSSAALEIVQLQNSLYSRYSTSMYKIDINEDLINNSISLVQTQVLNKGRSFNFYINNKGVYTRTGTLENDYCLEKYSLDFSSSESLLCNTPTDFKIESKTLGLDTNNAAILRSITVDDENLYIAGDFNEYKGTPIHNCILKYDGTTFTSFGEDKSFIPLTYTTSNKCADTVSEFGNNIFLRAYTQFSTTAYKIKTYAFDKSTSLSNNILPEESSILSINFKNNYNYFYNSNVYDLSLNYIDSINNYLNTPPKILHHEDYIYAFNRELAYASDKHKKTTSLILVDSNGNMIKSFTSDAVLINKVYKSGDHIYIGGYFTQFENKNRKNLVRLNLDMSVDTSFPDFQFNNQVYDIKIDKNKNLYILGKYTSFVDLFGITRTNKYLIKLDENLEFDTNFIDLNSTNIDTNTTLALPRIFLDEVDADESKHSLFLYGGFTSLESHPTKNIAKILLNDEIIDTNFTSLWDSTSGIAAGCNGINPNEIIVGFYKSSSIKYDNQMATVFIIDKNSGALLNTIDLGSDKVYDMKVYNSKLYLTGSSTTVLDSNYIEEKSIYSYYGNDVLIDETGIYVGGLFDNILSQPRHNIMKLNQDLTIDQYSFGDYR